MPVIEVLMSKPFTALSLFLAASLSAFWGCASSPRDARTPLKTGADANEAASRIEPTPLPAESKPPATRAVPNHVETSCFNGEIFMLVRRHGRGAGPRIGGVRLTVRRVVDKKGKTITLDYLRWNSPDKPYLAGKEIMKVDGNRFRSIDEDGITASGELEGEPWAWTGWISRTEGGGRTKVTKAILDDEGLYVERWEPPWNDPESMSPPGAGQWVFDLKPVERSLCDRAFRMLKK